MNRLANTPTNYSTLKSAEIALSKLKSEYRNEKYFNLIHWNIKIQTGTKDRYIGFGEIEEKHTCFECSQPMSLDEHNYGTPELPVCIQCFSYAQNENGANR